ncbi:hypothetical protein GYMLUDRAFT_43610 [Collybiopsis luxurians FD-317 M1]|uniref:Nitronate monooxygenase n=1 Tax=Collybiopsis luxurians FD-317 M1 TaxID=944289 RepID=A0A0D0CW51_9AGAR|nr:hypothetical protein GYMLUDRAFT_43610 [Collybiopsis luxurians FD-317 M1]
MNYPAAVARLTKLLGIRTPLIVPPMAGVSGGALAAQVTNGGGLGFLAHVHMSELPLARSLLESKVTESDTLPIGVGYLAWMLDKLPAKEAESVLNTALASNVQAHWFAFGNDLGRWIRYVRENAPQGKKTPLIFVLINSVEEAVRAVEDFKADVIVAQGIESGGHGGDYAPPLSELLQTVLDRFAGSSQLPIIVAAGGLANGADIASQIARGASGAVLGTRFLLTPESKYTDAQRQALIAARSEDAVRTMAFDYARGTTDWPKGVDGRGLRNDTVSDFEKGVNLEVLQAKFKEGIQRQDQSRFLVWAGTGVGSMNRIVPAKDLVQELHLKMLEHLKDTA